MPAIKLQKGPTVVFREIANASYVVAGNNSVSNVAIDDEVVDSGTVTRLFWTGPVTIARGGTTVFTSPAGSSGSWSLYESGITLDPDVNTANLDITVGANSTVIIELRKKTNFASEYLVG